MARSSDSTVGSSVPDFGATVRRERLLRVVEGLGCRALLISAPGGYGKSVLAAQVASELFDEAAWIEASELPPEPRAVFEVVARRLGASVPSSASDGVLSAACGEEEILSLIGGSARGIRSNRLCVVLDGVRVSDGGAALMDLARVIARPAPTKTLLVATTRCEVQADPISCVLDAQDLLMSSREAADLGNLVMGAAVSAAALQRLLEVTQGQPALLAVVLRHWVRAGRSGEDDLELTEDLRGLLLSFAEQLDMDARRALYAAALLGSGDCADVAAVVGDDGGRLLPGLCRQLPLLRMGAGGKSSRSFRLHDLACEALTSGPFVDSIEGGCDILHSAVACLTDSGRQARALELLLEGRGEHILVDWLGAHGSRLITEGHAALVEQALAALGSAGTMQTRVLLVSAKVAADREDLDQALRRALAAYRLATEEGDVPTAVDALVLVTRVHITRGAFADASEHFDALFSLERSSLSADALASVEAMAGAIKAVQGVPSDPEAHFGEARRIIALGSVSPETAARCLNYEAGARAWSRGDTLSAAKVLRGALRFVPISNRTREYLIGNTAACLVDTGRLDSAFVVIDELHAHCRSSRAGEPTPSYWSVKAAALFARGELAVATRLARDSIAACLRDGDLICAGENLIYSSVMHLAVGDTETGLSDAEEAFETMVSLSLPVFIERAAVQMRAALLALGDTSAAGHVVSSRDWALEHGASHIALFADLVMAEIDRREARPREAGERLRNHSDYILSENANWVTAMYIRAFPGLLGLLAAAVGADRLPSRLLKLLLPEHVAAAMPLGRGVLDDASWERLAERLKYRSGEEPAPMAEPAFEGCAVRLFGGFEVTTPSGPVQARAWRKRKARLLFAMLVTRRGQHIPRDVICEHLWPEMDEVHARNNFYVVWSTMKNALSPEAARTESCPYAEHVSGTCRLVAEAVRSDLDVFDECAARARRGEAAGDLAGAAVAYERLKEVYRGDLMSGDMYDDWFASLRDRYRHEFGDAMMRAASVSQDLGDAGAALAFARAGLMHDPWREDLYQAALRLQIETGQRGAAIETYMTCRAKMVEDLGLDPSAETMRLYEQVLAMEEGPDGDATV